MTLDDEQREPRPVVIATDSLVPSGVGEHILTLGRALSKRYHVIVAFPVNGGGPEFLARARDCALNNFPIGKDEADLTSRLKALSPALLHVHAGVGWEGQALASAGWAAGVPVIRTEHLPYVLTDERQKQEHRLSLGFVDRMIFVSETVAETHRRAVGLSDDRGSIVLNGIEAPKPGRRRVETRAALHLSETDRVAVTVARFTAQKDHETLIRAVRQVVEARPEARFLLVGSGPGMAAMQKLAENLGVADAVSFLGERCDVADLLAASDLFILSSLFEGLPLALLEAMAIGLPVVATRIGGTAEALGKDYPWLVEAGKVAGLSELVILALGDERRCQELGRDNRHRFEQFFRAELMAAKTAEIYQAVVSERPT